MKSTILIFLLSCLAVFGQGIVISGNSQASGNAGFGTVVPVSGSSAGPFTWVAFASNAWNSATLITSTNVQLTSVASGDTIIAWVKHESVPQTISISDGTTSFTAATKINHANGDMSSQFFYLPSSVASGTVTYTVSTAGAGIKFVALHVWRYSHSGGTVAFDVEPTGGGFSGTGTSFTTPSFTTTGAHNVNVAGFANYGSSTEISQTINGVTEQHQNGPDAIKCETFDVIQNTTFTGTAVCGVGSSSAGNLNCITLKTQ